jgi:hypothetical protein
MIAGLWCGKDSDDDDAVKRLQATRQPGDPILPIAGSCFAVIVILICRPYPGPWAGSEQAIGEMCGITPPFSPSAPIFAARTAAWKTSVAAAPRPFWLPIRMQQRQYRLLPLLLRQTGQRGFEPPANRRNHRCARSSGRPGSANPRTRSARCRRVRVHHIERAEPLGDLPAQCGDSLRDEVDG